MRERRELRTTSRAGRSRHNRQLSEIFPPFSGIKITVPVTLCLIVAHVVLFLIPGLTRKLLPTSFGECDFSRHGGVVRNLLLRMIATFLHARVSHLIYDIALLLGIGISLEPSMGSLCFAITLPILEVFSEWLRFIVNSHLGTLSRFLNTSKCVVGCSTTLFALKVILEKHSHVYSMPALAFHLSKWVGLFALYASVPETSATGHVCGILVGCVYLCLNSRRDTFRSAAVSIWQLLSNMIVTSGNQSTNTTNRGFQYQNKRFQREDRTGYAAADILEWSCQSCWRKNGVFFSVCDFCGTPRSLSGQHVPSAPLWQEDDRSGYLLS